MIRWIPYTFVRTVFCFIAGIVTAMYFPDLLHAGVGVVFAFVLIAAYFTLALSRPAVRRRFNPGWVALPLVALLGYLHLLGRTEVRHPDHLANYSGTISHYQAVVTGYAEERQKSWRVEVQIVRVKDRNWVEKRGRALLYFSKEDFPLPFSYGDVLLVRGTPRRPEAPANPGEFDYRAYLALRNIYHQHFLRAGAVAQVGYAPQHRIMALAYRLRRNAEQVFKTYVPDPRSQGIVKALVLGVTDGLDNELRDAYAGTGAMHILAVSGLHVSVIYYILGVLLRPLRRIRGGPWWVAFTSISLLWLYAFVTGLSPSVLRAVTMFSFLNIAQPWRRGTNVYNTLAVSAFIMLLADPFMVRSVGFQLSYLAVLGIVYFYRRLIVLWEPTHRITWELWKAATVSIAAQITTTPLGLLYFNQFPNYFLIANLIVVPLSSVVLIGGLVLLPLSAVPTLASLAGVALSWAIKVLNGIVFFLEGLPGSVAEGLYITTLQCLLLYAIVILLCILFEYRKFKYAMATAVFVLMFAATQWLHFFKEVNTQKMIVYKVVGAQAIDFIDAGRAYFLADSVLYADPSKAEYHVQPNRLRSGVKQVSVGFPAVREKAGCRWIYWQGKTILLISGPDATIPSDLTIDWLVVGGNAALDAQYIAERVVCRSVILDSSNSFLYASRFVEEAKLYKLDVHSVLHDGAFVAHIESNTENGDT